MFFGWYCSVPQPLTCASRSLFVGGMGSTRYCEVRDSSIAGLGTFALRELYAGQEVFRESAFFTSRKGISIDGYDTSTSLLLPASNHIIARLSAIAVQHEHCPACVMLAPTDTGGTLGGSEETLWFARAYAASLKQTRAEIQALGSFGGDESHAIVDVIRAEVAVLRDLDTKLRLIPTDDLERAVHRYWANTFGQEGSLHMRGSRFNHSCAPNCTRVALKNNGERAFVTLRPVAIGEELTLSYLPSRMEVMGTVVRRRHLWLSRGFLCNCDRCFEPQDILRQVSCPECAALSRQGYGPSSGRSISSSTSTPICQYEKEQTQMIPLGRAEGAFADWWNQSGIWVCRRCGWCSDPAEGSSSNSLHRAEGILSAEIFALLMANILSSSASASSVGSVDGISPRSGTESQESQQLLWEKRNAIRGILDSSVARLGGRHWVTFCCARMQLEQEVATLLETSPLPNPSLNAVLTPSSSPSATTQRLQNLGCAMRDLNGLAQWLGTVLGPVVSHPPAYYLFDIVCDLVNLTGSANWEEGLGRGLGGLLTSVEVWVSVFADEQQREKFRVAIGETDSNES